MQRDQYVDSSIIEYCILDIIVVSKSKEDKSIALPENVNIYVMQPINSLFKAYSYPILA